MQDGAPVTNIINLQVDLINDQDFLSLSDVLDDFKSRSVIATFFFTPSFAASHPKAVQQVKSNLHFIGLLVEEDISGMEKDEQKNLLKSKISAVARSAGLEEKEIHNIKLKALKQNRDTYYVIRELGINTLTSLFNDPALCEIQGETSEGTCGYCRAVEGKINHIYPTIYGFWAIPLSTLEEDGKNVPLVEDNFKEDFFAKIQEKYQNTKATPEHISLRFITASFSPSQYKDSSLPGLVDEVSKTGGVIKGFDDDITITAGGNHISSLVITEVDDPVCSKMDVTAKVTYSNTLFCPTYYFRTYGKYPSETTWKKLEEHSEFTTSGTHSYEAKFDIPEPEEVAKKDKKYHIRVVGQDCVSSSGPCWPTADNYQKKDEKIVDIAHFETFFSKGLKEYEGQFKDKVYRRTQDFPTFNTEIKPKIPKGGKVKAEVYKKDIAARLKEIPLQGGGNNFKGVWDWSNEVGWKPPEGIQIGNYTLKLFVERNGRKICESPPSFYTIFNTPAIGAAEKRAYLYDDAGTRDTNSIHYNLYSDWKGAPVERYLRWDESVRALNQYDEHLFEITINAVDGQKTESVAAEGLMNAVANVIFYTTPHGGPVDAMYAGVKKEDFEKAYNGIEDQFIRGQCLDYAHSLAAMYRGIGIPARVATDIQNGGFTYHQWTEAYISSPPAGSDKWYTYDGMDYTDPHTEANDLASPAQGSASRKTAPYGDDAYEVPVGKPLWSDNGGFLRLNYTHNFIYRANAAASDASFEKCEEKKYDNTSCNIDPPIPPQVVNITLGEEYTVYDSLPAKVEVFNPNATTLSGQLTVTLYRIDGRSDGRDVFGDPQLNTSGSGVIGEIMVQITDTVSVPANSSVENIYFFSINKTQYPFDAYIGEAILTNVSAGVQEGDLHKFDLLPGYSAISSIPQAFPEDSFSVTLNLTNTRAISLNNIQVVFEHPSYYSTTDPLNQTVSILLPGESAALVWDITPLEVRREAERMFSFEMSSDNAGNHSMNVFYRITRPVDFSIGSEKTTVEPPSGATVIQMNVTVANAGDLNATAVNVSLFPDQDILVEPSYWLIPSLAPEEEYVQAINVTYSTVNDGVIDILAKDGSGHNSSGVLIIDVNYSKTNATFTESFFDQGIDADSDGKFNVLVVNAQVNVNQSASYTVNGWLVDSDGLPILANFTTLFLSSGLQNVTLSFPGTAISSSQKDGPYNVSLITISQVNFSTSDAKVDYSTRSYNYTQFEGFASLNGIVKNASGSPVGAVEVSITGPIVLSVFSAPDGSYSFANLPKGTYSVIAYPSPYHNLYWSVSSVTLSSGQQASLNFSLSARGSVSGKVTDANGTPINDTFIYEDVFEPPQWPTNNTGDYIVPFLIAGNHPIKIATGQWFIFVEGVYYGYGSSALVGVNLSKTTRVDFTQQLPPGCIDNDGDGFYGNCSIQSDCNDNNASWIGVKDDIYLNANTFICPGTYSVQDQGAAGVMIVNVNNITLECNGAIIKGTNVGSGIYVFSKANVTISNCQIENYNDGIDIISTTGARIQNVTLKGNGYYGIYLPSSNRNTLTSMTVMQNYYGVYLYYSSNNTVEKSSIEGNVGRGAYLYSNSKYNNISKNTFNNSGFSVYDMELTAGADYNIIGGNIFYGGGVNDNGLENDYCSDPNFFAPGSSEPFQSQICDCTDADGDKTYAYNATSCQIGNDCDDNNPFVIGVVDDLYLNHDVLVCPGSYSVNDGIENGIFIMNVSDMILDCQGAEIIGTNSGKGIYSNGKDNITIKDCAVRDYQYGIHLFSSDLSIVENSTVSFNSYYGIVAESSANNVLRSIVAKNNGYSGIQMSFSSNNSIELTNVSQNYYGLYLEYSHNNSIHDINSKENAYYGIYLYGSVLNTIKNSNILKNYYNIYLDSYADNNTFLYNNILNATAYGMIIYYSQNTLLEFNNIFGSAIYNVYNSQPYNVSAENNWWGTTDSGQIAAKIYDNADNPSYGIVDYDPWLTAPFSFIIVHDLQCEESSLWQPCSGVAYGETLTRVRANVSSVFGAVTNGTFSLLNIQDNNTSFSGFSSTFESGWLVFDNPDTFIQDSGDWRLSVVAFDDKGGQGSDARDWSVPWGSLIGELISPTNEMNVSNGQQFAFTTKITCIGGECGSIKAIADPEVTITLDPVACSGPLASDICGFGEIYELIGPDVQFCTFADPVPEGNKVTSVVIDHPGFSTDCALNPTEYYLGSTLIGTRSSDYSCICDYADRFPPIASSVFEDGWPGYIYGGTNNATVSAPSFDDYFYYEKSPFFTLTFIYEKSSGKGIIPMNNGSPFYTIDENPRISQGCLQNMKDGNMCETTWQVIANATNGTFEFFTIYEPSQYNGEYAGNRTSRVNITIGGQTNNTAPVISDLPDLNNTEDAGLLDNLLHLPDYATDGETNPENLTYTIVSQTNVSVIDCSIDAGKNLDCTTQPNEFGSSAVTIQVSDGQFTDTDDLLMIILPINDQPTVTDIPNVTVAEDSQDSSIDLDDFVSDVEDSDGSLVWTASGNVNIQVTINSNHSVTFTPVANWFGEETITFMVQDTGGLNASDASVVTITPVNDAPILAAVGNMEIKENQTLIIDLNATDIDSSSLSFATDAQEYDSFDPQTGLFIWTPGFDAAGNYTITFNVTDSQLADEETIVITVQNTNRVPKITSIPNTTAIRGRLYIYDVDAQDPDSQPLVYSLLEKPLGMTINQTSGLIQWQVDPPGSLLGTAYVPNKVNVSVQASDGELADIQKYTITLMPTRL